MAALCVIALCAGYSVQSSSVLLRSSTSLPSVPDIQGVRRTIALTFLLLLALLHNDSAFRLKALLYNVWSIRAFN
jgi:hypothetical protein